MQHHSFFRNLPPLENRVVSTPSYLIYLEGTSLNCLLVFALKLFILKKPACELKQYYLRSAMDS